ncbi:MAG: hypothetical protein E7270_09725 [Lachnospiraceae bacterium]|nr:hypothetical protein [Lachnospiraceae bacterium]
MSKLNCEVIKDLLPLYVENLVSSSTKIIVEEHLATCKKCQEEKESLSKEMLMPQNTDIKAMKNISVRLFRKKVSTICLSVLTMILIFVLIALNLNAPIVLTYEKVEEAIEVSENEMGELIISIKDPTLEVDIEYTLGEEGVYTADVSCYTTKWKQIFEKDSVGDRVVSISGEKTINRISFYPSITGENVYLYENIEMNNNIGEGYVTLPRLVLHYYMFFAILLSLAGVIVCVCLRKRKNVFYTALKVTLIPVTYLITSLVILTGKGDIYNSMYYFSGILICTILLTMIGWCGIALFRYRKSKA